MKIVKIDAEISRKLISTTAHGLSAHFERMKFGAMPSPRSPLYKDLSPDQVLDQWYEILDKYADSYPRFVAYDKSRRVKVGPQGGYPPLSDRMDKLEEYFTRPTTASIVSSDVYRRIIRNARTTLFGSSHSLRRLTPAQVLARRDAEDKLDTNSGLPDFGRRKRPEISSKAVLDATNGTWKMYPAILGSRSSRQKPRFIFMFPMSTNLVELGYEIAIKDAIRHNKTQQVSAWEGFDEVELSLHAQDAFVSRFKVSTDFTGMDQSFGQEQMLIVWDIVAPVFQPQYREGLKESLLHATTIDIMIQRDTLVSGAHGLASGSGWTNTAETILAVAWHEYLKILMNCEISAPMRGDQVLGDDGIFTTNANLDFASVIAASAHEFGLEANSDKQRIDNYTAVYLQRFFDESIHITGTEIVAGCYPTTLALNSAMFPETFHSPKKWNERMETLRWIMILENCHHVPKPIFHELIRFVMKGDRLMLGLNIPGWLEGGIENDFKLAKTIRNLVPTYTEASRRRGIKKFDVIKFLERN